MNTMLLKDQGIPKSHRLQVVHLYKANYNLILGVKWQQVLHHAVATGLLIILWNYGEIRWNYITFTALEAQNSSWFLKIVI